MKAIKILLCHNQYRIRGGEDVAFEQEIQLLTPHHEVQTMLVQNAAMSDATFLDRLSLAQRTIWNAQAYRDLRARLWQWRPDIVHFHNTFPLLSPAAYHACKQAGIPVVQTLHNYRLLCVNALLSYEGQPCEVCVGKAVPYPGIIRGCYRQSRLGSAAVGLMNGLHRAIGTWERDVDAYIALTEFARKKFIRGGLPAGKIYLKPNFVTPDPGAGAHAERTALFVGRLSPEKGLGVLQAAWGRLNGEIPLTVVGDGPMEQELREWADRTPGVTATGALPRTETLDLMKRAAFLIVPSVAYESFSLAVVEALATGLPVVVSDHGAPAELVAPGVTGLHFQMGNAADLAEKVQWLWANEGACRNMGRAGRFEYESKYTASRNYERLIQIYDAVRSGGCETCRPSPH